MSVTACQYNLWPQSLERPHDCGIVLLVTGMWIDPCPQTPQKEHVFFFPFFHDKKIWFPATFPLNYHKLSIQSPSKVVLQQDLPDQYEWFSIGSQW